MTQPTKTPLSDSPATQTNSTNSTSELDFSFFDDPSPPRQSTVADNDFSFFDAPASTENSALSTKTSDTGFSFDDDTTESKDSVTQPEIPAEVSNQLPEKTDKNRMSFTCLKCSAIEQIDLPDYIEQNFKISCNACSTPIQITLESNAKRATQKSHEIYCSYCGHTLDQHPHCPSCGQFCPDYYIVEDPAEVQRKARIARSNSIKQALANLKTSLTWTPGSHEATSSSRASYRTSSLSTKSGSFISSRTNVVKIVAISLILIVAVALPVLYFYNLKIEQRYVTNYIKTIYALHVGSEMILSSMNKAENEWKSARATGRGYTPTTDSDLEARSAKIGTEVTKLINELQQKVPEKYTPSNTKLTAFHTEFIQLQKVATRAPTSYEELTARIATTEKNVQQRKQDIKTSLDQKLQNELKAAKTKFRGFNDF
jgi:hypothetical protein